MSSVFERRGAAALEPAGARLDSVAGLLVCCAPLLVLTVRGWANAVLYLAAILATVLLVRGNLPQPALSARDRQWARALMLTYAAPLVATVISTFLRRYFEQSQYDSPSRFLLAIPIFLFALRSGWPVGRVMRWVLPIALVLAFADLQIFGQDPRWPPFRITTRVVDPLVFGYFSLAFGLMALVSIAPRDWRPGFRWSVLLRVATLGLAIYLSILSFSRTGWAAIPLVIVLWGHYYWGRAHRLASAAVVAGVLLLLVGLYLLVPSVAFRMHEAWNDVAHYPWHGVLTRETSIGYRITFLRMAVDLFAAHPLSGIGDLGRAVALPAGIHAYASPDAIAYALHSGFHNQIASNAVRNGVAGLVATSALLLVPLAICARGLYRGSPAARKDAMMGLAYCLCVVVSSISTEVVDLKFAASFYAVMTAAYCGAVLGRRGPEEDA